MAAGSGADRKRGACVPQVYVPVCVDKLAFISNDLISIMFELRWSRNAHELETDAAAAAAADPDGERQLDLGRDLHAHIVLSENSFFSTVNIIEDVLEEAVDPEWRPRPESAAWWRRRRRMRFVHVSWEELERVGQLVADAMERAGRMLPLAEDLDRELWPWEGPEAAATAAAILSTPVLLQRLRRAQRLADDVLVPLGELKRLVDRLIGTDHPRVGRGRGRSPTPPRAAAAHQHKRRRSASI